MYSQSKSKSRGDEMAGMTSNIERFLKELLSESEGSIEIGRNDLAERFGCAPSQINYVLSTRFTPYRGYYIESKRGGSGYIRIIELTVNIDSSIRKLIDEGIGNNITKGKADSIVKSLEEKEIASKTEGLLMRHAIDDSALEGVPVNMRNTVRASILKNMLIVFLR